MPIVLTTAPEAPRGPWTQTDHRLWQEALMRHLASAVSPGWTVREADATFPDLSSTIACLAVLAVPLSPRMATQVAHAAAVGMPVWWIPLRAVDVLIPYPVGLPPALAQWGPRHLFRDRWAGLQHRWPWVTLPEWWAWGPWISAHAPVVPWVFANAFIA
jgi:hypothetical protein